ncbi:MAG: VCBS repeat-containing protein, partial [Bacteroidetes bacterium]
MQVLVSLLLVLCLCNCADLYAQSIRLERSFPPVRVDGDPLNLAFAGGLNSPQFSAADLNNDGRTDLLAFDRVGHVPLAFVREVDGTFSFRPELLEHFPQVVGWMLLRDYDGDEVPDIFAYQGLPVSSVQVYRGRYNAAGKLEFTPYPFGRNPNVIHVPVPGSTNDTQLYVSEIDVPDINDIDYDGDLDILTFNFAGGYLEYYQNQSVEQGYGADSLIFELVETCWGGIYESGLSTALDLSSEAGECASNFGPGVGGRHSGSTVLTLDEDGDGDKDLLLGDISFPYLTFGRNGGDRNLAWINEQDETFPADDVPANLPLFPAPFYVDVDGDQVRDLVVTTNQERNGIDHENVWYYQNTNTDSDPRFRLFQQDLLVGEMLDLGTGCRPAILDYNADGLM